MKNNPGLKMEISGHTDSVGTEPYNKGLSARRANAVMAYLVQKGIAKERIKTSWYGFTKPVAPNSTKESRALNRRAEVRPVP